LPIIKPPHFLYECPSRLVARPLRFRKDHKVRRSVAGHLNKARGRMGDFYTKNRPEYPVIPVVFQWFLSYHPIIFIQDQ
jgi:hypothetical protein